jgi:hypothetical protein
MLLGSASLVFPLLDFGVAKLDLSISLMFASAFQPSSQTLLIRTPFL